METIRHEKTCTVIQEKTGKHIEAEVIFLKNHDKLSVIINNSIKLTLVWNGRVYEGRMAGMDFISDGPVIHAVADHSKGRYHR
jgi:hypothetical protein